MTRTFVELEVSPTAYDEIAGKLREAGYGHVFCGSREEGLELIDMHGIALSRAAERGELSAAEKAAKYEQIASGLWDLVLNGSVLHSILAAHIVRQFRIVGPNDEDPEGA